MRPETTPRPITPGVLRPPPSDLETEESRVSPWEFPLRSTAPPAEHDPTLLGAALERLEAQRAAMAWLLEADLLPLLLV